MFQGVFTALITPFAENGAVDEAAFRDFVEWQIAEGVHGIVPCGTTGESATLSHEEHQRVVELAVKTAKGRVPVVAGTGSNATEEAVFLSRHAEKAGADALLIVAPYYNKPTQEGLFQHYRAINDAVGLPIIVYNIPGRSVINIADETLARLSELKNIKAVKDATGDLNRPLSLKGLVGDRLAQLSGEDTTALAFNAQGGVGCISVTSNIAPRMCADLQNRWFAGDIKGAMALSEALYPLSQSMFIETNPVPVKYAVSRLGFGRADVRLPLVPLSAETRRKVEAEMDRLNLAAGGGRRAVA